MDTELLKVSEAAAIIGIHPATLRRYADEGQIPSRRLPGGFRIFRRDDVAKFAAHIRGEDTPT